MLHSAVRVMFSSKVFDCQLQLRVTVAISKHILYYWWGGTKSLGTAATSGVLYQAQIMRMIVEQLVE
jgi:hypothetical protein